MNYMWGDRKIFKAYEEYIVSDYGGLNIYSNILQCVLIIHKM